MANRNGSHSLPPRPPLSSHQSNSVPSTPHQHAREFRSHSRSPSPHTGLGLGSHSPRSVKSESNGPMPALPKGRPTCKYETSAAFSRRRMQYDIGDAPLETPKEEPKKALDPDERKKLSGDMRELYDRLLPSEESDKRRLMFVDKLENILRQQWPEAEFKVLIFGSSGNLLCTSESDVDICIQTPMKKLETMHMLAEVLANNGMERVICIAAAKVPIVKLWDPELQLSADMNVNNTLALENTRMIKTYVQIDDRVRPLAMIVKHWSKQRILNDAGIGGTLSSYAWICMILNFLQTRKPPILPALHQLPHKEYKAQDGTESGFNDDMEKLRDYGAANKETLGELLFHFYRRYAHEMDYETSVISVRHGKVLSRKEKNWDLSSKEGQWRLCIEEPFNTSRNLGNSADSTAFRGIHLELRRAFEHLANGVQLEKAVEAYEYPPEEKFIFKKPVAGPLPILSSAIPPTQPSNRGGSRGGGTMRGLRNNGNSNGTRQGTGYRRSSSGASFGRQQYPPFLNSPPIGVVGSDYMSVNSPEAIARFQEQLLQQSQITGLQLEQLKHRFAMGNRQIEAATAHAHHTANRGSAHVSQANSATVSPQKTPYMTGSSSPQLGHNNMVYPEYMYQAMYAGQPLSQSVSADGSRTNPSSPSLANAVPRRSMQRSGFGSGTQASSNPRSHSQPARGLPQGFATPGYPHFVGVPGYGIPTYALSNASQDLSSMSQSSSDTATNFDSSSLYRTASMPVQDPTPKEYVGYYMPNSTQVPAMAQMASPRMPVFGSLPRIPQFSELAHRRNRPSQDMNLTLSGTRRISRSPSPLGHQRTFSIPMRSSNASLRSAPLPKLVPDSRADRMDSAHAAKEQRFPSTSPAVVNGSLSIARTPESRSVASDEDLSSNGLDDSNNGLFSDGLGLSGFQQPYAPDYSRHQYPSAVYSPPGTRAEYPVQALEAQENQTPTYSPPVEFPPFVDPQMPPISSLAEEHVISPKTVQPTWTKLPPLDTAKAALTATKHGEPKTAPVLSPVYETRTPSPTATRRLGHFRQTSVNGILPATNGDVPKANGIHTVREPIPPTPVGRTDLGSSTADKGKQVAGGSTWQEQPGRRKNRKRSKSGPGPAKSGQSLGGRSPNPNSNLGNANEGRARHVVAPAIDGERKGG